VIEPASETWKEIVKWAEANRLNATMRLCAHGTGMEETEYQRGRASVLNELLALTKPQPDLTGMSRPDRKTGY